jgi:hypothetical protein
VCETEITSLCFCLFDTHDHFFDLVILVTEFYYSKFTLCGPCEKVSEISRGSLPSTAPPLFPVRPCFSSLRLHDAAGRLFSDRSIISLPIPTSRPRARGRAAARLPPPARLLHPGVPPTLGAAPPPSGPPTTGTPSLHLDGGHGAPSRS